MNTENFSIEADENTTLLRDHDIDRVIEAILFAAGEPLKPKDIAVRFPEVGIDDIHDSIERLVEVYQNRGFGLVCRDEAWAFRTQPDVSGYLTLEKSIEKKLSRAAMETLAIIAYHQPVTRAEIENIRGVAVGKGTLDLLIESGWIQPGRRREVPGRPLTWKTAPTFLDHFGLESLKELPGMDDLKAAGLLDRRPSFEIAPETAELFDGDEDDVSRHGDG